MEDRGEGQKDEMKTVAEQKYPRTYERGDREVRLQDRQTFWGFGRHIELRSHVPHAPHGPIGGFIWLHLA